MRESIKMMQNMAKMEEKHASALNESVDELSNVVIKEALRSIAHDSQKHAGLYTAILSLLKDESPPISEEDYDLIENVIRKHIDVEEQMIRETKKLLDLKQDLRVIDLLREIYNDEEKHHKLMKRMLEGVIKREALFEADWWDFTWKDALGHGSPGG